MSLFQDKTDWFEQIARQHVDIHHDDNDDTFAFCRVNNMEELDAAMVSAMSFPALVYQDAFGKLSTHDNSWLTNQFTHTIAILSLKDVGDPVKADVIQEMYDEAFGIMQQIIARMWQQYQEDPCNFPFRRLDFEQFTYRPIGPLESNVYGWELSFTEESEASGLTYDETKWSS